MTYLYLGAHPASRNEERVGEIRLIAQMFSAHLYERAHPEHPRTSTPASTAPTGLKNTFRASVTGAAGSARSEGHGSERTDAREGI